MTITEEGFKWLKMHCKVDHHYEDDLLKAYYEWAKEDIASAVTDEYEKHKDWFDKQTSFRTGVFPLTAYYYENRIAFNERTLSYAPHMVMSVVHRLRSRFIDYIGSDENEI